MRYLFGPVPSRRLGMSLGVDLIPPKTCTFDCLYCEVGRTTRKTLVRQEYFSTTAICAELEAFLQQSQSQPDYITLAGSGEPTLHAGLGKIISWLKERIPLPVAVLTNGSLLYRPEVCQELLKADVVLPSLDAVSPAVFQAINRPIQGLTIEQIIAGLFRFREEYPGEIWLEILLLQGINDGDEELAKLKAMALKLAPEKIHLNTAVRPGPEPEAAKPLAPDTLQDIARYFGPPAEVISSFGPGCQPVFSLTEADFLATLARRPQTVWDLAKVLGLSEPEVQQRLEQLCQKGLITVRSHQGRLYYQTAH